MVPAYLLPLEISTCKMGNSLCDQAHLQTSENLSQGLLRTSQIPHRWSHQAGPRNVWSSASIRTGTCCQVPRSAGTSFGPDDSLGDLPLTSRTEIPPSKWEGGKESSPQKASCHLASSPHCPSHTARGACGCVVSGVKVSDPNL